MTPETCKITEPFPGVFATLLPFCSSRLLQHLLVADRGHVLVWGHHTGNFTWRPYVLPFGEAGQQTQVHCRSVEFDFVVDTSAFQRLLPSLRPAISMVQLDRFPPNHLDLSRIQGRERYRLLSESSWLFQFVTPGNDFGELLAPSRSFLEAFLHNDALDFTDLP